MDIVYHFAGKTFIPARNLLIEGNTEQVLEQRVSDLLLAFCQQPNQELSKNELITLVWPDRVVNEDSLSVAISKLRKALGDNRHNPAYIKTLSGRGYLWLATVDSDENSPQPTTSVPATTPERDSPPTPRRLRKPLWAGLSLVLTVGLIGAFLLHQPSSTDTTEAVVSAEVIAQHDQLTTQLRQVDPDNQRDVIKKARLITEDHPEFLPAYLTIAQAKLNLSMLNSYRDIAIYQPEIESIVDFVLTRDPENGRAWLYRGWLAQIADWEYETAGSAYMNALKYSPDDPLVYLGYSEYLMALGDFDRAHTFFDQLRRENPDYYKYLNMSFVYMLQGDYDKARAEVHRIANSEAESRLAQRVLNRIAILSGNDDEAFATLQRLMRKVDLPKTFIEQLETLFLRDGLAAVYQKLLDERIDKNLGHHLPPLAWARYAVIAGDFEQAIRWLNEAVNTKQPAAVFIPLDPLYQPLASLPKFQQVTQRIEQQISR